MGSSFPSRSSRHVHRVVGSPGPKQGQWEARYAIHASRQLSGEVLRSRLLLTRFASVGPSHFCWSLHVAMQVGLYLHRLRCQAYSL